MTVFNSSAQFGQYAWVEYIVRTTGSIDVCGQWFVGVSANIAGVANSALTRTGLYMVEAKRQIPVSNYNQTYTTSGGHTATTTIPFFVLNASSSSQATVGNRPPDEPPIELCGGIVQAEDPYNPECISPLVLDRGKRGISLTDPSSGVSFDINADGILDRVAWTTADSEDSFLVLDRNGNGVIDDGAELFGSATPTEIGSGLTTPNGFEALKFLESRSYGISHPNMVIDSRDAAYDRLILWTDRNHNGLSEADELESAADAGLRQRWHKLSRAANTRQIG